MVSLRYLIILSLCYIIPLKATEENPGILTSQNNFKGKPDSYWTHTLSPEVYEICRKKGTEKAGSGPYDKFYEKGTYYCACCGGDFPLFSSVAKYDSKTGWPSFWEPIADQQIELVKETNILNRLFGATTEVRCARCGSHLGHVFDDGPQPTGKRYCINSLALKFVRKKD